MTDKWNLFTSNNKTETSKDQSKSKFGVITKEENDQDYKDKGRTEKFGERKKRSFYELESDRKGFTPAIKNLPTVTSENLVMKNVDRISNLPNQTFSTFQPSFQGQSVVNVDSVKLSKIEALKILAGESIEKFLYLDEKLIDTDRNIGSSTVNPYFTKKLNSNFLIRNKLNYPKFLFDIFNNVNERDAKFSFSGIFMPLNLLYFVRDNHIYLWDFQIDELYTYKEISNVIVNLHITLPKAGVFSPEVSHIMIVATTNEIFIILLVPHPESKKLTFRKSDFVYDTHDITTSICTTSERRVFLGSQNNYLYELDYTNVYSFFGFSKKAKKITHSSQSFIEKIIPDVFNFRKFSYMSKLVVDNTRHLLYSLVYFTKNENTIFNPELVYDSLVQIYDLGEDGTDFKKLGEITQANIKERYNFLSNQPLKKDQGFIILDIYPITRADSKYYNLVIVTKNGIRAYVSFDNILSTKAIKDEEKISEFDKNKIFKLRPSMNFTMILKQIPEPSNATIIEGNEYDLALRALQKSFTYNQIFLIDKKFFIFYKDDFKKRSYIDVVEHEEADAIKLQEQYTNLNLFRNKESISNILKFDIIKEIYTVMKIPFSQRGSYALDFDLANLLKLIEIENVIPRNLNFLDSSEHLSYSCMHSYAKQIFLPPDEFVVMTSSELVTVCEMRPIDNLFKIISESESEIREDLFSFISEHGISETYVMLLTMMCNRNFVFYRRHEEIIVQNESYSDNVNASKILMLDPTEIRNNEKIIYIATNYFIKLIDFSLRGLNININLDEKNAEKGKAPEVNMIGQFAEDIHTQKINFISYALFMYLARIGRVFWEEHLYNRSLNENEILSESMKIHQMKYLQCILTDFQIKVRDCRDKIIQRASEVDVKLKSYNVNVYDFSNLSNEIDEVLYLSEKFIETLQFVEFLYEMSTLKRYLFRQPKNLVREMTNLKFKDIILNSNIPMIKQWIEEYFEVALNENDYYSVGAKLDELCVLCPSILSKNDKEIITANMLMRLSKSKKEDEISKKNLVGKAVKLMGQNPENIKLEKNVAILSEIGEVRPIVELCVKKAMHLKTLLEKDGERNLSLSNVDLTSININEKQPPGSKSSLKTAFLSQYLKDYYFNEYKQCFYIILKLLNEINMAIKFHDKDYESNAPGYIKEIIKGKRLSLQDKVAMRTAVIEEILKFDNKFLHDLLFDHLKSEDMLDDILKYESPYIESYLSEQVEKEKTNPKRFDALYKFYLNSNNYQGALRILLKLVNFDNSQIEFGDKYVNLEDRRTYAKHLIFTYDKLLETEKKEEAKNFYIKNRNQVINMRDSYLIQAEIMLQLRNCLDKTPTNPKYEQTFREAIYDLDRNYYSLGDLYFKIARKFKLYEINFLIFFEMNSKGIEIDPQEVIDNYDKYFDFVTTNSNLKWPNALFPTLNKIFNSYIEAKTSYENFYHLLRDNNYKNILNHIIPLDYLIKKIESFNWIFIIKEKEIDFEKKSDDKYDSPENPFWFVKFLTEVVNLPCFYLFDLYHQILDSFTEETQKSVFNLNIMQIIKMWSQNIETYFTRVEKKDPRIPKSISDDYNEFIKRQSFLQNFLRKIYNSYSRTSMKILLETESKKRVLSFCQKIENKLEQVINYNIKVSKKKAFEPLGMFSAVKDIKEKKEDERALFEEDNKGTKQKGVYTISNNILDQCD